MAFDGIHMNLGNIQRLSDAETRLVTAEVTDTPQFEVESIGQVWRKDRAARALSNTSGLLSIRGSVAISS